MLPNKIYFKKLYFFYFNIKIILNIGKANNNHNILLSFHTRLPLYISKGANGNKSTTRVVVETNKK